MYSKFWIIFGICLLMIGCMAQEPEGEGEGEGEGEEELPAGGGGDNPESEEEAGGGETAPAVETTESTPAEEEPSTEEDVPTTAATETEVDPDPEPELCPEPDPGSDNRTLIKVTSILVPPYIMEPSPENANVTAGDRHCGHTHGDYVGFLIDLLDAIGKELNVRYEITLSNEYGSQLGDQWSGMIGEVVRGNAELAVAPLTVTMDREEVVDFTHPFERFDTVAVFQRRPWNHDQPVNSLDDLFEYDFQFGVAKEGSTREALQMRATVENEIVQRMWNSVITNDYQGFQDNNNRGVRRARWDPQYAFLMEQSSADWVLRQKPCDLDSVPTGVRTGQYAMAVQNQDALRDDINRAMMELHHKGVFSKLQKKWWPDECSGAKRTGISGGMVASLALIFLLLRVL